MVTTTASFVDLPLLDGTASWFKPSRLTTTIVFYNTGGANGASWQVLGSLDGTDFTPVVLASANVAFGTTGNTTITTYWPWLKIQVKDQVAASHTTVKALGAAFQS